MNLPHPRWRRGAVLGARCACLWVSLWALAGTPARAHGGADQVPAPAAVAVQSALPALVPGTAELRFGDMFRLPVGPRGLEPSQRLQALQGQRVRMVGYMAAAEQPLAGRLVLVPVPVSLGEEDEALADDLPPNAVFVELSGPAAAAALPNYAGLLRVEGRLSVGARPEPDGRVSFVRLLLDAAASTELAPVRAVAVHP